MDTINLIEKIKLLGTQKFIQWYINIIVFNSGTSFEEKILYEAIPEGITDRFYKLFSHLESYETDTINEYNDLISLIIPDLDYYVKQAKFELINKILSNKKIFVITLGNEDSIKLITQQISCKEEVQGCYESSSKLVEFIRGHHEHKIIKVISDCEFTKWLKPDVIVRFKKNIDSSTFYEFEIKGAGIINRSLEQYELKVESCI